MLWPPFMVLVMSYLIPIILNNLNKTFRDGQIKWLDGIMFRVKQMNKTVGSICNQARFKQHLMCFYGIIALMIS